jgi:hypothetical protein
MDVHIYYVTAAGNSISSQLGSSCQGNRYGKEKAGTCRSQPGGPTCWANPLALGLIGSDPTCYQSPCRRRLSIHSSTSLIISYYVRKLPRKIDVWFIDRVRVCAAVKNKSSTIFYINVIQGGTWVYLR